MTERNDDPDSLDAEPDVSNVVSHSSRKLLVLIVVGGLILYVVHATPLSALFRDWRSISDHFQRDSIISVVYYLTACTILVGAGMPRLVFYAFAGFVFGFWEGLALAQLGSLLGSYLTFRVARWGSRQWVVERYGHNRLFKRIVEARPTIASVFVIRQFPVSNGILNAGLALGHVGNTAFLAGSFLGFLPQGIASTIVGSGLADDTPWSGTLQLGLAAVLIAGSVIWSSRRQRQ